MIIVNNSNACDWYEYEAKASAWSALTLRRNIQSQCYYRILGLKDKGFVKRKMLDKTIEYQLNKLNHIKNPVILDFLGLENKHTKSENNNK